MSNLIDRQAAINALDKIPLRGMKEEGGKLHALVSLAQVWIVLEQLPSAEPKTPSNGSITSMNTEKMHVRTTDDCISRQDVLHELEGCDYELKDWQRWKLKTMVRDIPSAEKAQLSEKDATSVCKCPCEYREPCDYCHYDAYRGHGCPAEEGMKDG